MNTLRLAALFSALAVASAAAQTPGPTRVRGTITGVDGNTVSVKSREGQDLKIELAPNATFAYMKSVNLAEVKAGTPLGTTVVNISGRLIARELHLFNPGRPIPNEGTRPADLEPDSLMTNATVAAVRARVSAVQSPANAEIELVLTYKGGEQHVIIPPGIPIVTAVESDRSVVVPGEYAYIAATAGADGKLTATRLQVSKDGVKPPQ